MSPTIQSLGIDRLSAEERLQLIGEIWDSLEAETQARELPLWQREELDRRLAEAEANPEEGVSLDQLRESLLKDDGE